MNLCGSGFCDIMGSPHCWLRLRLLMSDNSAASILQLSDLRNIVAHIFSSVLFGLVGYPLKRLSQIILVYFKERIG